MEAWRIILFGALIVTAAVANVFMDLSAEDRFKRVWWNKSQSWVRKWLHGDSTNGPAFPGSTTIFVWTTDGWHFFQFIFHTCWQIALAMWTPYPIWIFIGTKILFSGVFELLYKALRNYLIKKKKSDSGK